MADKRMVKLVTKAHRQRAIALVSSAPEGYVVTIQEPTRSLEANAKMWAMLQDISRCQPMGRKHTPDDWKAIAMNACGWECQFIEGLDGRPFPQGFRSSNLTVRQMSVLIEFLYSLGAEHGVIWTDPQDRMVA